MVEILNHAKFMLGSRVYEDLRALWSKISKISNLKDKGRIMSKQIEDSSKAYDIPSDQKEGILQLLR